jgi:hypothetical protein
VRKLRTAFVAGAAVIAAAGFVSAAAAASSFHVLTVRLPDGSLEQIRYLGDQPPEVSLGQASLPLVSPAFGLIGPDPVFADLDRISADMDRSAAAMLDEARRMEAHAFASPDRLLNIDFGNAPPGTRAYSMVSTLSGGHVCTRSVQYSWSSDGKAPRVVTRTSGDCGPGRGRSVSSPPRRFFEPVRSPRLIEVNDRPGEMRKADPERGLLQTVSASEALN